MIAAETIIEALRGLLNVTGNTRPAQSAMMLSASDNERFTTLHVCGACGVTWWTCFADRNSLQRPDWCCSPR